MSDISIDADYDFPYEIRSAGDSGLGCFATRDIKPGEIILVDFTTIMIPIDGEDEKKYSQLAEIYQELDEEDQLEWMTLATHIRRNRWALYCTIYGQQGPGGQPLFGEGTPESYAMRASQFDCNSFEIIGPGLLALYLSASRFNHSCDPNVWYENELVVGRWVGRANRNIAEGEELFISYIACHAQTAQRQASIQGWDFTCECDKCLARNDIYTAFLEDARDVANDIGVDWARSISAFADDIQGMENQLVRRVNLLKQANQQNAADGNQDRSFQKELVFALWDLAWFHEHYYILSRSDGDMENFLRHLESALDYIRQAATIAARIWPRTHEVVMLIQKEIQRWQNTWNRRNQPVRVNVR